MDYAISLRMTNITMINTLGLTMINTLGSIITLRMANMIIIIFVQVGHKQSSLMGMVYPSPSHEVPNSINLCLIQ